MEQKRGMAAIVDPLFNVAMFALGNSEGSSDRLCRNLLRSQAMPRSYSRAVLLDQAVQRPPRFLNSVFFGPSIPLHCVSASHRRDGFDHDVIRPDRILQGALRQLSPGSVVTPLGYSSCRKTVGSRDNTIMSSLFPLSR